MGAHVCSLLLIGQIHSLLPLSSLLLLSHFAPPSLELALLPHDAMANPQERLAQMKIDDKQLTQQDIEFMAFAQRKALINIFGGATLGFVAPYLASQSTHNAGREGASRLFARAIPS